MCAQGFNMTKLSEFSQNLLYLRNRKGLSQQEFALAVEIDRSALSRLETGERTPQAVHLEKLAVYSGLTDPEDLLIAHETFRRIINNQDVKTNLMLLSFRSIKKNLERCESIVKTYGGQYTVYYGRTEPSADTTKQIVTSLLTIEQSTTEGIVFHFVNPYQEQNGEWSAFEYSGLMYPVSEFLYFIGEQSKNEYEILSMIMQTSPTPKVTTLRGIITGIGVQKDRSFIAARPLVALRRQKPIADWRSVLNKELGYLPEGRIPELVRRELSNEQITIR
jgi:transcriptional regulator with XRE-family HTH domain